MNTEEEQSAKKTHQLTPSQMRLWKSQALSPDSPLLNQVITVRFEEDLFDHANLDRFTAAWNRLVQRHPVLQCVISNTDKQIPQQYCSDVTPALQVVTLDQSASGDGQQPSDRIEQWIEARKVQLFDLGQSLTDAAVVRINSQTSLFYLGMHHLIADAWSMMLLWEELITEFNRNACLNHKHLNFFDYASYLAEAGRNKQPPEKILQSGQALARRPDFYAYPSRHVSTRSLRKPLDLKHSLFSNLASINKDPEIRIINQNLFWMTMHLTALVIYCHRTTGDEHIGIEIPLLGRFDRKWMQTAGNFIEMARLTISVSSSDSVLGVIQNCRDALYTLLKNAKPGMSQSLDIAPTHAVLNFITARKANGTNPDSCRNFKIEWHHSGHSDAHHPLRLHVSDWNDNNSADLHLDINSGFFDIDKHDRITGHLISVYSALTFDRNVSINDVSLLQHSEIWRLEGSKQSLNYNLSLLQRIDHVADKNGSSIAISDGKTEINYADLTTRTQFISQYLQKQIGGRNARVAIFLPRSIDIPQVILGVLRSGAAYIPIDITQPRLRLQKILADADVSCVITDNENRGLIPSSIVTITTEMLFNSAGQTTDDNSDSSVLPEDTAYIIYTSGSTGNPKGVAISHKSLLSYLCWANNYYRLEQPLRMPFFTSISFDLTLTSLLLPLLNGGTVRVFDQHAVADSATLLDVLSDKSINTIKLTPAHLAILVEQNYSGSAIEQIIVGGEDLKSALAAKTRKHFPFPVRIINEYGPTEATVGCIVKDWKSQKSVGGSVPIGTPITNMNAYLLDPSGKPTLEGVAGELYLSGPGLAQGYWADAALTDQNFIQCSWQSEHKLYRTGDIARVVDNELVYLGRNDHQIKRSGYRIDIGELESTALEHAEITGSVAIAMQHQASDATNNTTTKCVQCGLDSQHPDAQIGSDGTCQICKDFSINKERIQSYFKSSKILKKLIEQIKSQHSTQYDALVLLSGGKDSTYALCKLVEMGLTVRAFSLDNGFLSDHAKDNINRVCNNLGIEHHYATTEHMNQIFVDSLQRHSNVCNGCFKTIYTLALKYASAHGIKTIFTGLSRGQLFETRLSIGLFSAKDVHDSAIDDMVTAARLRYHAFEDAANTLLAIDEVNNGELVKQIEIIDFYRYFHVELADMLNYIQTRAGWIRPPDTGRSTNCLINDVGIHVHKVEKGFHNYSLPYSWDVRMGHKNREDALEELNDAINLQQVESILNQVGYKPKSKQESKTDIALYYTARNPLSASELRDWLRERLPHFMLPDSAHQIDTIPLTKSGKVNRDQLESQNRITTVKPGRRLPNTPEEHILAKIWQSYVDAHVIHADDNFFELGGDSLSAIRSVADLNKQGYQLEPVALFQFPELAQLALRLQKAEVHIPKDHNNDKVQKFANLAPEQQKKLAALLNSSANRSID